LNAPSKKKRVSGKKEAESKRVVKENAPKQTREYSLTEAKQAGLNFRPARRGGPLVDGRRRSAPEANVPSLEESVPQVLGEGVGHLASQPQLTKGQEKGLHENAKPTMINVRSEGFRLDLVLLQNRISGLTIDFQNNSKSSELQRWLKIIDGMLSGSAPSPGGSVPRNFSEPTRLPASQPQPLKEEREELPREKEVLEEPLEEPPVEKEEQELPGEKEKEPSKEIDYRKIVLRAADVGLDTLGHDQKQAVLGLLEGEYGFRESDIPNHPRGFIEVLDEILGPSSRTVEREIMSNIRLVRAVPGENLETVVKSLKEQTFEPSSTAGS
jgi:ribosomal protein L13E